jgi:hypothetical protein
MRATTSAAPHKLLIVLGLMVEVLGTSYLTLELDMAFNAELTAWRGEVHNSIGVRGGLR